MSAEHKKTNPNQDAMLRQVGRTAYHKAYDLIEDHHDAEDAAQEVAVSAWRAGLHFDPGNVDSVRAVNGWAKTTARRVVTDHWRASATRSRTASLVRQEAPQVDSFEEGVIDGIVIGDALRGLSPNHRRAVVAVDILEHTSTEAAEALDVVPGTIKSRVHYGRAALQRAFAAEDQESDGTTNYDPDVLARLPRGYGRLLAFVASGMSFEGIAAKFGLNANLVEKTHAHAVSKYKRYRDSKQRGS